MKGGEEDAGTRRRGKEYGPCDAGVALKSKRGEKERSYSGHPDHMKL